MRADSDLSKGGVGSERGMPVSTLSHGGRALERWAFWEGLRSDGSKKRITFGKGRDNDPVKALLADGAP